MNRSIVQGNWKQLKGKVKAHWGRLFGGPSDVIAGNVDEATGKIQETYGVAKDEAEEQIKRLEK